MNKDSMLEDFLYVNSDKYKNKREYFLKKDKADETASKLRMEEIDKENELYSKNLGISNDEGFLCQYITDTWYKKPQVDKEWIVEILKNKSPIELHNSISTIKHFLLVWSKNLIVDDVLDDLAKYVIAKQITGDKVFSLNSIHINESRNNKPAHRPKQPDYIYIDTLMVYFEAGSISKAAKIIGKTNKTVRENLKIIIGNDYAKIPNKTHPQYKKISMAYDIWKSEKNK